jgi:hypothetical protein
MGTVALLIPTDRKMPAGVQIEGSVTCCVCREDIDQSAVEREEVVFATGKLGIYPAHVVHFFRTNPVTGELSQSANYERNLELFAVAYASGEQLCNPSVPPRNKHA